MLSYRHDYHAGNIGDLVKHATLSLVIDYLKQKPAPIRYIDTHAGAGLYATQSAMAEKTGEYNTGAGSLNDSVFPEQLQSWQRVLNHYATQHQYPGSPLLAAKMLREQDDLWLYELHSTDFPRLQNLFARDRRVHVAQTDGYASLKGLLPVKNSRALILIDPSYELQSDYKAVRDCLEEGYKRMPHAVFVIWYPVVGNPLLETMTRKITALATDKLWRLELSIESEEQQGMVATGVLVLNPPWTLAADMEKAFQAICPQLPFPAARFTATCLKP